MHATELDKRCRSDETRSNLYRRVAASVKTNRSPRHDSERIEFEWVLAEGVVVILIYRGCSPFRQAATERRETIKPTLNNERTAVAVERDSI